MSERVSSWVCSLACHLIPNPELSCRKLSFLIVLYVCRVQVDIDGTVDKKRDPGGAATRCVLLRYRNKQQ